MHVLLHAAEEPVFGLAMKRELERHGYRISPGTLYPLLHGLKRAGLLRPVAGSARERRRRLYRITPRGRKALAEARAKVNELNRELHEAHPRRIAGGV
jgi:PadR family transcriptional regulator, regulatory protein PadR